jgi:protocatechuate 3,4-dioxygenase beta subunit
VVLVVLAGCGGASSSPEPDRTAAKRTCAPTDGHAESVSPAPAGTPSRVRLGPGMELKATTRTLAGARAGTPLEVTGVVRGADCEPLDGATINVWQTNGKGRYGPLVGGHDRCCYLTGTMRTRADGRYSFVSVMPRGYAGGPPHIHVEAGHPGAQGIVTEIVFDAPVAAYEFEVVLE